jgi:hypothetical protein
MIIDHSAMEAENYRKTVRKRRRAGAQNWARRVQNWARLVQNTYENKYKNEKSRKIFLKFLQLVNFDLSSVK